jgi:hypothetical protein
MVSPGEPRHADHRHDVAALVEEQKRMREQMQAFMDRFSSDRS